jgi:hypothetical protein
MLPRSAQAEAGESIAEGPARAEPAVEVAEADDWGLPLAVGLTAHGPRLDIGDPVG